MLIKFRVPDIVLGSLLTIAVFAAGYVVASSVPPPSQQIEKTDHPQTANEGAERTAEKQIAYYTKWLAWFTGALVAVAGIQGYFLLRADKTARIAANAADLNARAAIALELPIINARTHNFGFGISQDDSGRFEYFSLVSFDFNNLGNTRANPIELRWGWTVGDKLPTVPVYPLSKSFDMDVVLEADQPATIVEMNVGQFEMRLASGDTDKIVNNQTTLWVYCCLVYEDFMRTKHEEGFCWKRRESVGGRTFTPDATPAYNRKT